MGRRALPVVPVFIGERLMRTFFAVALSLCLAWSTGAAAETLKFYGYAYDLKTNRYLYTEVHHQNVDGVRWLGGTILYYTADGTLIGDKTLDFSADPYIDRKSTRLNSSH